MYKFIFILFVASNVFAKTQIDSKTDFSQKDTRGAYQEIHINDFQIKLDYFSEMKQMELLGAATNNKKYDTWPDQFAKKNRFEQFGSYVEIFIQDKELKTINEKSEHYSLLDLNKSFVRIRAVLNFQNEIESMQGFYNVRGIVTLVTGTFSVGPMDINLQPLPGFVNDSQMCYTCSGAFRYDGSAFNEFGNGALDFGNIFSFGLVSRQIKDNNIGYLKSIMGDFLQEAVYP